MLARLVTRIIAAQAAWARPLGDFNQRWLSALFRPLRPVKDFLNGKWLGHSLHAALTDLPVGVLTLAIVFDVLDLRMAADIAIAFGILAILAAALAGLADYTDTDAHPRMVATVHATLMVLALTIYVVSLAMRLGDPAGDRLLPFIVALVGYGVLTSGAWVGGEIVYALGNMVNRHAWRFGGTPDWVRLDIAEVPEGVPTRAKAGAQSVVLVRRGETIHAMHDTCSHAGGPLSDGRIVDGALECPWHFSRYELATGRRVGGPTTFDQPRYEVRAAEGGGYEARRLTGTTGQNV
jgi:nitrite reductase/ring-hydroxylating ferredoxin subunit